MSPQFFFVNHNYIQVQLSLDVFFLQIYYGKTAVGLLKLSNLTLFSFKFTCRVYKRGKILLAALIYTASNYLPHI